MLPALVTGVVSRSAFDHPLSRRRAPERERQRFASMLQLAIPAYQRATVGVRFAPPLLARAGVHDAVFAAMRALLLDA